MKISTIILALVTAILATGAAASMTENTATASDYMAAAGAHPNPCGSACPDEPTKPEPPDPTAPMSEWIAYQLELAEYYEELGAWLDCMKAFYNWPFNEAQIPPPCAACGPLPDLPEGNPPSAEDCAAYQAANAAWATCAAENCND